MNDGGTPLKKLNSNRGTRIEMIRRKDSGPPTDLEPSRNAYTDQWKRDILDGGADLVGVADTTAFRNYETIPPDLLGGFPRAIAVAVRLPTAVFETISDEPTPIYAAVYQTANRM
ncbi:MAG: hypothetical protein JRI36_12110, partial [Deltaproteobacteria bacterium]|nr:hypothetical protein [Deltaproteobacteria bacterium]